MAYFSSATAKNKSMKEVKSLAELKKELAENLNTYLLLIKSDSEISKCAAEQYKKLSFEGREENLLIADVLVVRDIHPEYGVSSVPAFLTFKAETHTNTYKGCNSTSFFKNIVEGNFISANRPASDSTQKSVTVYTTPSCSWCTRLKSYLNKNGVYYSEVNVAANPNAADELIRQTGQQGVPQTNIGGEWIVGFNQQRINQLLNIK